jgi:hypothetical protein
MFRRIGCALVLVAVAGCDHSSSSSSSPPVENDGGTFNPDPDPPVPSTCAEPTAPAVKHDTGSIDKDETWGPGLHDVTFSPHVSANATLTIAPCAVVRMGVGVLLQVRDGGKLVAQGKADQRVTFQDLDGALYAGIEVDGPGGFADLAYVTIKGGGDPDNTRARSGAPLHLSGSLTGSLVPLAKVDHVTFDGPSRYGVALEARAGFADGSQSLVVMNSGELAVRSSAAGVGTIPVGKYTGNKTDAIRVIPDTYVSEDVTIHDRGVPYVVGGDGQFANIRVVGDTTAKAALLTIEPGVTMKFPKSDRHSSIDVETAGALVAVGTKDKPVIFTSSETTQAPGDWIGIRLIGAPDPRTRIDFAEVHYAGGDTGTSSFSCGTPPNVHDPGLNIAAIAIFAQPPSEIVTNTKISNSGSNGIERAWTGDPVDFLGGNNTFENIPFCRQTFPQPNPPASCPDPAPCD